MRFLLFLLLGLLPLTAQITYEGTSGPGKGKHIVFVASDHEYRTEETCPALARILAEHHGFKTTVCFGVDQKGFIKAGASRIEGLEALKDADLMVIFARFLDLPDEQMKHIADYIDRGGPVVGLRTSSHAFKIKPGKTYSHYDFQYEGEEFEKGFGHQILGNTWVGHYGKNHKQATRIQLIPSQKKNPILTGVADNALTMAGAYVGIPDDTFTVLTESQPLKGMTIDSPADETKPPSPSTWTRYYTSTSGRKARVFHSTQGASQDILDPNYRRLILNGIYWAVGMEGEIKADSKIDFVGAYQPSRFSFGGEVKGVKPSDLADINSPIMPKNEANKNHGSANKTDGRNKESAIEAPGKDPGLAKYYINFKTSPRAERAEPVATTLPLQLRKGDRIAFIGNLLLDAERRHGHLETLLHHHHPDHQLTIRNLAWPADEVDLMPRPDNFGDLDQHLTYFKADVIFAAFGANESFGGSDGLSSFKERLDRFLTHLKTQAYNGEAAARIVLISPVANEEEAGERNNANLRLYSNALAEAAKNHGIGFVDVMDKLPTIYISKLRPNTSDGYQLNAQGHAVFAGATMKALFGQDPSVINEDLRKLVVDKATQFFYRYRPLNTFYYTGARNKSYGYLDFLPAMRNFDMMVANRDNAIHATASTGKLVQPDDSNLPKLDDVLLSRGANKFLSVADEQAAFKVDPRFEVNCFASEEDFPEMACPIQMRWDKHGRLWVSTSVTYPHVYPGQKPQDKIIILEDTDQDGKADTCTTWADDLHIPLSFVLDGNGGVYCSEEPHLTHLTDRDGDGKMDHREILFTGFGCEDSHHALHDFTWTPGGDLLFRESIFHNTQVETAYGPIRAKNSSWFLYHPSSKKLTAFGAYPNTNPWGVTFDKWGNHVASHPVFASTFHATNPVYPAQHSAVGKDFQAYSGTCGHDFVDHEFWPEEMQGGFIKARYKPTNKIEFHTWTEKEDHFAEEFQFDLIFSTNLSFIPVDLHFGPRGDLYICDWYNPVKGHAQYSLRDPRRDRKAGRIWRVIPKGAKLPPAPKIAGASITELLEHLKSPNYRTRYFAKRELRTKDKEAVLTAVSNYLQNYSGLHDTSLMLLEALWVQQAFDSADPAFLGRLLNEDDPLVAASAFGVMRFSKTPSMLVRSFLNRGASHPSQHVRREAVLCASYLGSKETVEAISPVLDLPAGPHLSYAITTAFNSAALKPYWLPGTAEKLKRFAPKATEKKDRRSKEQRKFDSQKNLATIQIGTIPERLLFTKTKLSATPGQPLRLIFSNPDATEHNLLILAKDTPIQEIGEAANLMAADPEAAKKHYIPDDKRILHATKMLKQGQSQTLRFNAPSEPGTYPYLCTFPGHWIIMKGELIVK
ncbi:MAG: PVC-type heme-binding CxxCH protein [Verrucomicrobiaceae bacterium]